MKNANKLKIAKSTIVVFNQGVPVVGLDTDKMWTTLGTPLTSRF
jgi:hypothetical protein